MRRLTRAQRRELKLQARALAGWAAVGIGVGLFAVGFVALFQHSLG